MSESSSDGTGFWILAILAYVATWIMVNIFPSLWEYGYAFREIGALTQNRHTFHAYLFIILILAAIAGQIYFWYKNREKEMRRFDPFYWPMWGAGLVGAIGFVVSAGWLVKEYHDSSFFSELWQAGTGGKIFAVVSGVIALVLSAVIMALLETFAAFCLLSALTHAPILNLFLGILVSTATWFGKSEVAPLALLQNAADMVDPLSQFWKGAITTISAIISAAAAGYKGFEVWSDWDAL